MPSWEDRELLSKLTTTGDPDFLPILMPPAPTQPGVSQPLD